MIEYLAKTTYEAKENTTLDILPVKEFLPQNTNLSLKHAWINVGGWQSWNPGFEIKPGEEQEKLTCHVIHPFNKYLVFPESKYHTSKNLVLGQFVVYIRWDKFYLVFASTGNIENSTPPVQFIFNRKEETISFEIADKGKNWKEGELQAQIQVFTADSYFEAKEKLTQIFGSSDKSNPSYTKRFQQLDTLGTPALGWESWYNHYANIDAKLIETDLKALNTTDNFIKLTDKTGSVVFQIDDGWEKQLGNWTIDDKKFPYGLENLSKQISDAGYIPGLWIAPFIIDLRSPIALQHPDWLLRDNKNNLISTGFNPLWGVYGTFYALDLSNDDVLSYLDGIIDTIINQWGFRFLKLDFLYAGMLYGSFANKGAAYEWYSRAINTLTARKLNNKGEPVIYLGCGAPLELSINQFPLCRIGCDTFENWENKLSKKLRVSGRNSAYMNLKDTLGHAMWDKTIFANDPDVLFVRNNNCTLTKDEKLLIATVNILFGSQLMFSDDPAQSVSEEEIALSKEINEIRKKYEKERFGVWNTDKDMFFIQSESGKYSGTINLGKEHYIKIQENQQ